MPYLNLDFNYFEHPKTRRLVASLGRGSESLPIKLWAYCAKVHPKDGRLKGYSVAEFEGVIGWDGEPGKAAESMGRIGFISATENGFQCVDWLQHQGHISAFSRRGRDNAKKRWAGYATSIPTSNAKKESGNAPSLPTIPILPSPPTKTEAGPSRPPSDVQSIVEAYKAIKGIAFDDVKWNKSHFPRFSKSAAALLATTTCLENALSYLKARGSYLNGKNLEWTLETIAKNAADLAPTTDAKFTQETFVPTKVDPSKLEQFQERWGE